MNEIESYLNHEGPQFEAELFEWLRIPSIGTDSEFDAQTRAAAEWLANKFKGLQLKTELIETSGASAGVRSIGTRRERASYPDLRTLRCATAGSPVALGFASL